MSGTWKRLQDWLTVVIGVLLFISPFVLGATGNQAAAWTAYAGGVLLAIAGLWSLMSSSPANHFPEWSEIVRRPGVSRALGAWVHGPHGACLERLDRRHSRGRTRWFSRAKRAQPPAARWPALGAVTGFGGVRPRGRAPEGSNSWLHNHATDSASRSAHVITFVGPGLL